MFSKFHVKKHERALVFRKGDFVGVLGPGSHRIWSRIWAPSRTDVQVFDTIKTRFEHPMLEVLVKEPALQEALLVLDLNDRQRALVWRDDRLAFIVGPGKHAFWRTPFELRVERFDVEAFRLEHPRLEAVLAHPQAAGWIQLVDVEAHQEVLVFKNGELLERFSHGRLVFWKHAGLLNWKVVDRREQMLDIAGQEIMTSDKVTLRLNLLVTYRVADAVKAVTMVADHAQALYKEAQLVLRAAVGSRTLDALLGDKEAIGSEVREALVRRAQEFGLEVRGIGLKDVILPGDMKTILNQVIAAEKQAQANLIKRREETAAARSQANTAKVLAENPILARMKELEALQEILAGAKVTFVLGDGDVVKRVRSLVGADAGGGGAS